jgi:hypothetical protein
MKWIAFALGMLLALSVSGCMDAKGPPVVVGPTAAIHEPFGDDAGDAPGPLDVIGGRFIETPQALVVEIQVSDLDLASLAGALSAAGYSGGWVEICWDNAAADPDEPEECAGVALSSGEGGTTTVQGYYEAYHGPANGCNDWYWCAWRVPYEVVPGSPATIQVHVPRDLMPVGSAGTNLTDPHATSWGHPYDAFGRRAFAWACPVVSCVSQGVPDATFGWRIEADSTDDGSDFQLALASAPSVHATAAEAGTPLLLDAAGDISNDVEGPRPDLDIVAVDLELTDTELAFVVSVAELDAAPTHNLDMEIGVGPTVYEAWYQAVAGQVADPGSGYCADEGCDTWVDAPIDVRFTAGTPGTIRISWMLADLAIGADRRITLAEAEMADPSVTSYRPEVPAPTLAYAFAGGAAWDSADYAAPYRVLGETPPA